MTFAGPLEGPRAPLFLSVAVALAVSPLQAQSVDQADLQRCAEMSTEQRRLACFESLVEDVPVAPVVEGVPGETSPAPPVYDTAPAVAAQPSAIAAVPTSSVTAPASAMPAPAAMTSADDAPTPNRAPSPTGSTADDFGAEYVEAPARVAKAETLAATVRSVTKDRYKRLTFEFANGQVWRQTEGRHFPYPKGDDFEVVITRGMLGDYQLRVGGEGRMTRIQRIK